MSAAGARLSSGGWGNYEEPKAYLVEPCDCGDCLSCELRSLRARHQGETPEDVLDRDRADFRVAKRALESMAGVL